MLNVYGPPVAMREKAAEAIIGLIHSGEEKADLTTRRGG
jgi:hypothetical protein